MSCAVDVCFGAGRKEARTQKQNGGSLVQKESKLYYIVQSAQQKGVTKGGAVDV